MTPTVRPDLAMTLRFRKYQGLGNDYIVLERDDLAGLAAAGAGYVVPGLPTALVRRICDRHFGVGSDGILVEEDVVAADAATAGRDAADATPERARFALRILNPDGSEAEKSGNGLRIFARSLWDDGRVGEEPFVVATRGGLVRCQVRGGGRTVFVEMGVARFDSAVVPVTGPRREVVAEEAEVAGERLRLTAVSMGNPHCVVHVPLVSEELARRLGPALEAHPLFPTHTNVQFCQVLAPDRIRIEIWERGAGYTLASGSSSCAAAAASVRLGHCRFGDLVVEMPGGTLAIGVGEDYAMTMFGPVGEVMRGTVAADVVDAALGA